MAPGATWKFAGILSTHNIGYFLQTLDTLGVCFLTFVHTRMMCMQIYIATLLGINLI